MTIYHPNFICKECSSSFKSSLSLSRHISQSHCNCKNYYLKHISMANGCEICGGDTTFIGIEKGFKRTCSHRCSAIMRRAELKSNPIKEAEFRRKLAKAVSKDWSEHDYSERISKMLTINSISQEILDVNWDIKDWEGLCNVFDIPLEREQF